VIAYEDSEILVLSKEDFLMLYQKSGQYQDIKDRILERIKNNFYGIKG
jgi:CRP-like cAMP-binding protein